MEQFPQIGDRLIDLSAAPDAARVRDWLGPEAFGQWCSLESWIDENYPGVFVPEWLNGKKRGWSRRYKKIRAFCTFVPEYRRFSVTIVFGGAEREKFEERRYTWRPQLVERYDRAKIYPDGMFLTLPIATADDRQEMIDLLVMKRPPHQSEGSTAIAPKRHAVRFQRE
jgi:hypothetical protein